MIRLFAALPVPNEISGRLARLQRDLAGARWRPEENFHVTLCFYGEVSQSQALKLDDLLGRITDPVFEIMVEGLGWFGHNRVTSVWARITQSDPLDALSRRCVEAARRLGISTDRHPFTPHITLAYLNAYPPESVRLWAQRHQDFRPVSFQATHFHLYSSLKAKQADISRYEPVADYPLTGFVSDF